MLFFYLLFFKSMNIFRAFIIVLYRPIQPYFLDNNLLLGFLHQAIKVKMTMITFSTTKFIDYPRTRILYKLKHMIANVHLKLYQIICMIMTSNYYFSYCTNILSLIVSRYFLVISLLPAALWMSYYLPLFIDINI